MHRTQQATKPVSSVRWQSVALPTEHGGWSFIGEPLLLGLLVAPSWGGFALAIAAMGVFLLRQPMKLFVKDVRSNRRVPRTVLALRFALIYGAITAVAGIVALLFLPSIVVALPMLLAMPLVAVQALYELRNQGRHVIAEIAGATATGAIASAIVMMQGWALLPALGLWLAVAVKGVTAVMYVRSRLRLERNAPAGVTLTITAHIVGLALLSLAAFYAFLPWTAPLAMLVLTARALHGLSPWRVSRPAKVIGVQEVIFGVVYVLLVALGYLLIP